MDKYLIFLKELLKKDIITKQTYLDAVKKYKEKRIWYYFYFYYQLFFLFILVVSFQVDVRKSMKKKKIKIVKISEFETRDSTKKFLDELSMLTKLNTIYEKKLITKNEYEKIRSTFKYVA